MPYGMNIYRRPKPAHVFDVVGIVSENLDYVKNLYKLAKIDFKLYTFIENIAEALDWSHVVICRCGSGTLSENLISGRPSIMLPLKLSVDNHQMKNALYIQNIGAGWIIYDLSLIHI